MTNIEFCNESTEIYKSIIDLCTTSITSLKKEEVENMYSSWNQLFDLESKDFKESRNAISANYVLPNDACCLGIDLPTWIDFKDAKEDRRRIMIVGIDPLRPDGTSEEVTIGTPYALHYKFMRNGRTREYWKFIELLAQDYSIYITDIYKVFFYGGEPKKNRSYCNEKFVETKCHHDILTKEIEFVNPNIIITMGNLASKLTARLVLNKSNQAYSPISKFNVAKNILESLLSDKNLQSQYK